MAPQSSSRFQERFRTCLSRQSKNKVGIARASAAGERYLRTCSHLFFIFWSRAQDDFAAALVEGTHDVQ